MSRTSSDWPDLPTDILITIARLLTSMFDFLALRGVCKSWRSAVTMDDFDSSIPQLPWLMFMSTDETLVTNPDECKKTIKFMDLFNNRRVYNRTMYTPPEYELGTEFFSSGCWLLGIKEDTINLELIHVTRGTRLGLPGLDTFPGFDTWYLRDGHGDYTYSNSSKLVNVPDLEVSRPRCFIKKMALLAFPGTLDNNFAVVVIWGDQNQLAFSRPGESSWTVFDSWDEYFSDVICHDGIVYALDFHRRIVSGDIHGQAPTKLQLRFTQICPDLYKYTKCYLVVDSSSGRFIVVCPHTFDDMSFMMFECDLSGGNDIKQQITNLGNNKALFLGFNSSMCLQLPAHDASASLKQIYFTDWNVYTHLYTHVYHLHKTRTGIYRYFFVEDCMPYPASGEAYVAPLLWVLPGL